MDCKSNSNIYSNLVSSINVYRCMYNLTYYDFDWKTYNVCTMKKSSDNLVKIYFDKKSEKLSSIQIKVNDLVDQSRSTSASNCTDGICYLDYFLNKSKQININYCNENVIVIYYDNVKAGSSKQLVSTKSYNDCYAQIYNEKNSKNSKTSAKQEQSLSPSDIDYINPLCEKIVDECYQYSSEVCVKCRTSYYLKSNSCVSWAEEFKGLPSLQQNMLLVLIVDYALTILLLMVCTVVRMYWYFPSHCDHRGAHSFVLPWYCIDFLVYNHKIRGMVLNSNSLYIKSECKCVPFILSWLLFILALAIPLLNLFFLLYYLYDSCSLASQYHHSLVKFKQSCNTGEYNLNAVNINNKNKSKSITKSNLSMSNRTVSDHTVDLDDEIMIDINTRRTTHRVSETVRVNDNPNSVVDRSSVRILKIEEVFRLKSLADYELKDIRILLFGVHDYINTQSGFDTAQTLVKVNKFYDVYKSELNLRMYLIVSIEDDRNSSNMVLEAAGLNLDNNVERSVGDLILENNNVLGHPVYAYWVQILNKVVFNIYFKDLDIFQIKIGKIESCLDSILENIE